MFGSKNRTISNLRDRLARAHEQRDWARAQHETSQANSRRIAAKFTDAHTLCWDENARLQEQVEGHQSLLARHARLLRATDRYLAEIWKLRAENTKLKADATGRDRALEPAPPTPELLRVTRERDQARALLKPMQDRLDAYQRQSEAEDWKRTRARIATPTPLAS